MTQHSTLDDRIVEAVSQTAGCLIEELMLACHDLTWNQAFLAVDRLSRVGRVRLTSLGRGLYKLALPIGAIGNGSTAGSRLAQGS